MGLGDEVVAKIGPVPTADLYEDDESASFDA
jgi:hypothetical protein